MANKLNKDFKQVMADAVLHVINTKQSKKSSYTMVAQGTRYKNVKVLTKITK